MTKYDVLVIGGGASGLVAAVMAARQGASVAVAEKLPRVGKKILATGNGRCNITNKNISPSRYFGDKSFAKSAFAKFGLDDTVKFFDSIGIMLTELDDGKMYPRSLQATTVLDQLREELKRLGVEVICDFDAVLIKKKDNKFYIKSRIGDELYASRVIVSCGGKAAPEFGTDGGAYELLKSLGHTVVKPFPALVQLKTQYVPKDLKGIKQNCTAQLLIDGKQKRRETGEVLFTAYGISGPPIFNLSRMASESLEQKRDTCVSLDFAPDIGYLKLKEIIDSRFKKLSHLSKENFLNGLLNKRIGLEILRHAETSEQIASLIKNYKLTVTGTLGFKNAQVTAGGISALELKENTMESKKVSGLYITGEIINIDGDCGGFNLQWAWTSGALAGIAAGGGN
ncbi:MAG: NAD(P)/FAD-dependent oxidoreductase [Clostridia bacterium]|nr:NAD(P)/FAD-dependent oxidoreductase [Clostridia bacterium]